MIKLNKIKSKLTMALIFMMLIIHSLVMTSCTENLQAKTFGGEITIDLADDKALVTATWKNNDLWYLVRDKEVGEEPETHTFIESSSFGQWEGTVIFVEHFNME